MKLNGFSHKISIHWKWRKPTPSEVYKALNVLIFDMGKKLKNEYKTSDLPEPCATSVDLEYALGFTEEQALKLFDYLHRCGRGQIFTQIDGERGETIYSKGIHVVNRTGIYAFVFGR